jgi:hypothetical protein
MSRLLIFALLVITLGASTTAQERFVKPVDEGPADASFAAFRKNVIAAAERKDVKFIISILDPGIKSSFGGHDGIADFKSLWKINNKDSQFWNEFLLVMRNGGKFERSQRNLSFTAPYLFSTMPEDLDQFENYVIFGNNVNLREKPNSEARIIDHLSYNIVKIEEPAAIKRKTGPGESDWAYEWHKVETLGGKKGWVKAEFVRSAVDYRAGFEKKRGAWKMTFFLAGD